MRKIDSNKVLNIPSSVNATTKEKSNEQDISLIKEEDMANLPTSEVSNFKSAANRITTGEAELAMRMMVTIAKAILLYEIVNSRMINQDIAAPKMPHAIKPPYATVVTKCKLRFINGTSNSRPSKNMKNIRAKNA